MKARRTSAGGMRSGVKPEDGSPSSRSPRAFVLVAILIVVMLASMLALSLLFRLQAEETAAAAGTGSEQAWAAAMSGANETMRLVAATASGGLEGTDIAGLFRERLLFDDGADRWYYTVYSRGADDLGEVRYGFADEAGKLTLNHATEEMLGKLPRMKPLLAHALLDFIDEDDQPHPEGAEQEYYDALPNPYAVFNGPLSTVDELMLVRGFPPAVVYGEDANQNFRLDANENDGDERFPPDDQDGNLESGLRPFITVSSYDLNVSSDGQPRVNLNTATNEFATNGLPATFLPYLNALHTNQVEIEHVSELLEAKQKFTDEAGKETELASGIGKNELALLLDRFTATDDETLPGLINVNAASVTVLQTVPGIDRALAEAIVSARAGLTPEKRRTTAWLFEDDIVDAEKFKQIAPYLTGRSYQYSFNVAGYGVPSGRYRVLEVIVDLAGGEPRITFLRDLTRLGLPFSINVSEEPQPGGVARAGAAIKGARTILSASHYARSGRSRTRLSALQVGRQHQFSFHHE